MIDVTCCHAEKPNISFVGIFIHSLQNQKYRLGLEYIMSLELIIINCKMTFVDSNLEKKHDSCRRSSTQCCLHCRRFTDVWKDTSAQTVIPILVLTNWHTILIAVPVVRFIGAPVNKTQCTVVWRPNVRPFHGKVISSDPVFTTLPPIRRTKSWQKKAMWWKTVC